MRDLLPVPLPLHGTVKGLRKHIHLLSVSDLLCIACPASTRPRHINPDLLSYALILLNPRNDHSALKVSLSGLSKRLACCPSFWINNPMSAVSTRTLVTQRPSNPTCDEKQKCSTRHHIPNRPAHS